MSAFFLPKVHKLVLNRDWQCFDITIVREYTRIHDSRAKV